MLQINNNTQSRVIKGENSLKLNVESPD